jgi:hypothetical protein
LARNISNDVRLSPGNLILPRIGDEFAEARFGD